MADTKKAPKGKYLVRLPLTLKIEAEEAAKAEGTTLNQLISVALADRVARIEERKVIERKKASGNQGKKKGAPSGERF